MFNTFNPVRASIPAIIMVCWGGVADAATFTVVNTASAGPGSLDQAIRDADANGVPDRINFNIPGAGPHTILVPALGYPPISGPTEIDGFSQPGSSPADLVNAADIRVVIDGSAMNGSTRLLQFNANGNRLRGLALHSAPVSPVILNGDDNVVTGCYIGTDVSGTIAMPNVNASGIFVGGERNEIGGVEPAKRNVISGNGRSGVFVLGAHNLIRGNYIGTDATGTQAIANVDNGVQITGDDNQIGESALLGSNLLSGNFKAGVSVVRGTRNVIKGNLIGTDKTGTQPVPNLDGVVIIGDSTVNTIGGATPDARNVISGNFQDGVEIHSRANLIRGNYIGADISGVAALPNLRGVQLHGSFNVVGGADPDAGNVISGNTDQGVLIAWALSVLPDPAGNLVLGNSIGADATRTAPLGNGGAGVHVQAADHNAIGAAVPGGGNLIVANGGHGVALVAEANQTTLGNLLFGNRIGLREDGGIVDMGNAGDGVFIDGAENSTIGGGLETMANVIAFNDGSGVAIEAGLGNAILRSAVFDNSGLKIDLGNDGRTLNDAGDIDVGPNNLQNWLNVVEAERVGADLHVEGFLDSAPKADYRVEIYSQDGCLNLHPPKLGFIEAVTLTTDKNGEGTFIYDQLLTEVWAGDGIVTTVSEMDGVIARNTSEFSTCVPVSGKARAATLREADAPPARSGL